jgi:hypothetical protein
VLYLAEKTGHYLTTVPALRRAILGGWHEAAKPVGIDTGAAASVIKALATP